MSYRKPLARPCWRKVREVRSRLEISGEWEWADGGVFGESCVRIHPGGGFIIPRQGMGALDIHGADCELSVCAWFLRESPDPWQALSGPRNVRELGGRCGVENFLAPDAEPFDQRLIVGGACDIDAFRRVVDEVKEQFVALAG